MMLTALLLTPLAAPGAPAAAPPGGLLAIRVGRAETVANGTLEHAVILVDGGKIVTVGEDLPIERGIPVLERPDWVVTPGWVNAYSRAGMEGRAGGGTHPAVRASSELFPDADEYEELLEAGITTLGLYPAGSALPGRAVAVRPHGATREEMVLADDVYLKIVMKSDGSSKKMIRDGFEEADKWIEKEKKAREKWDKEQEKKKKDKEKDKKKDDDDKKSASSDEDEEKKEDEGPDVYEPPEKDAEEAAFLALREKTLRALIRIDSASTYLHFLDALGDEDIDWALRVPLTRESDLFYVASKEDFPLEVDGIADRGLRIVLEPSITLTPSTMRQRNLPAELARKGAKLVLIPREDDLQNQREWARHTGELVAAGLDRQTALRAMTLEPAALLGLEERLGSIEEGKDANLVFWNGDPFEVASEVQAVMLDGDFVTGEVSW